MSDRFFLLKLPTAHRNFPSFFSMNEYYRSLIPLPTIKSFLPIGVDGEIKYRRSATFFACWPREEFGAILISTVPCSKIRYWISICKYAHLSTEFL